VAWGGAVNDAETSYLDFFLAAPCIKEIWRSRQTEVKKLLPKS
jgi:hypothetical protein